jgi:hypothetical protein
MAYTNGKIYKITGGGLTYYGSTIQPLYKRMYCHKHKSNYNSSKIIIETGEAIIVLVENYPCKSKEELFSRERLYIENNDCVNKKIPIKTQEEIKERKKQYSIDNKEKIKELNKKYEIINADKRKEQHKQYEIINADKRKEQHKLWYIANKERQNQYYIDNKEKIIKQRQNRIAKINNRVI